MDVSYQVTKEGEMVLMVREYCVVVMDLAWWERTVL